MEERLHTGFVLALSPLPMVLASRKTAMSSQSFLRRTPSPRRINGDFGDGPIRVLVVDDHPAIRAGIQSVLATEPDFAPVATAATASDAIDQARLLLPVVAIVDYHLPGRDGLSLTLELKRLPEPPGVLIYSAFADLRLAVGAIVAGADGVIEKTLGAEDLCAAVRAIAVGLRLMPALSIEALSAIAARVDAEDLPILGMLLNGVPPAEVAQTLGIAGEWLELRRWAIVRQVIAPEKLSRG